MGDTRSELFTDPDAEGYDPRELAAFRIRPQHLEASEDGPTIEVEFPDACLGEN
jgi:hypothetical protein